ncbi:TetR family transcriptional regulator [bacterium]|nr:TetR family transcriptional regulator [bacterium]
MPTKTTSIRKKKKAKESVSQKEPARTVLLRAAKPLFATKGLSETGIREISQAAGLNSSLISYHFGGKEGLYRACMEDIASDFLKMAEQTLDPPSSKPEYRAHLSLFIHQVIHLFLEDRHTGLILIREYDRSHSPAADVFQKSFFQVLKRIQSFLKKAKDLNLIKKDQDPTILSNLLFSCVIGQLRSDHLFKKVSKKSLSDKNFKNNLVAHIVELFIRP